jgi:hypothetical protein
VVDEQLSAAVEELHQRPRALVGLEAVLLLERDPGQLAALACELVAHPGVFLLALEQLLASRLPFLTAADLVLRHGICLLFVRHFYVLFACLRRRRRRRRSLLLLDYWPLLLFDYQLPDVQPTYL